MKNKNKRKRNLYDKRIKSKIKRLKKEVEFEGEIGKPARTIIEIQEIK